MTRTPLDHHNCSFARTVDIIGDRWCLMILRDAFYGVRRFSEFKQRLGITQAVLSARLGHLGSHDLLTREPAEGGSSRADYRLTRKGKALFPVVIALMQWGDEWIHGEIGPPIVLLDRSHARRVDRISVTAGGVAKTAHDLTFECGPGATQETYEAFAKLSQS